MVRVYFKLKRNRENDKRNGNRRKKGKRKAEKDGVR